MKRVFLLIITLIIFFCMADTVSEAAGAKKLLLRACHNISKKDFESGVTYLDLMAANAQSLKIALGSGEAIE